MAHNKSNTEESAGIERVKSEDRQIMLDEDTNPDIACSQMLESYSDVEASCAVPKHTPRGDVDLFEKMFQSWNNQETSTDIRDKCYEERLAHLQKNLSTMEVKMKDLEVTNDLLQKAINSSHNELHLIDKVGQENKSTKQKLKETKTALQEKDEELKRTCVNYEEKLSKAKTDHKAELEKLRKETDEAIGKRYSEMQEQLKKHKQETEILNQQLENSEKGKASEVAALTMEYEDKLAKVQRMKAVSSHSQPQTSAHQEIYRKKLQHLKSEYESETKNLKDQVRFLQTQLSAAQTCTSTTTGRQSVSPIPAFARRARKF